jgi:imidazolonepropionase-like amidohydrolase
LDFERSVAALLIKNALVHTGKGEVIADCDILIENGKIAALGKNLGGGGGRTAGAAGAIGAAAANSTAGTAVAGSAGSAAGLAGETGAIGAAAAATANSAAAAASIANAANAAVAAGEAAVIDMAGKHVFPGFIDGGDFIGAIDMAYHAKDYNENSGPVLPHLDIWHSIDPDEVVRQELYKSGITSIAVTPGNQSVIGGTACVIKTHGRNINRMTVRRDAALKGSVLSVVGKTFGAKGGPQTRMAMIHLLKGALEQSEYADDYRGRRSREVMDAVRRGDMPLIVAAETAAEIESVIDAVGRTGARLAFALAFQAARAREAVKRAGAGIVLGETAWDAAALYNEVDFSELAAMAGDGVDFSISLLAPDFIHGRECYWWTAAKFLQGGADEGLVLGMMCANPARLYGVADRIGALAPGMDADLAIFDGNPFAQVGARLLETIIDGEPVYVAKTGARA